MKRGSSWLMVRLRCTRDTHFRSVLQLPRRTSKRSAWWLLPSSNVPYAGRATHLADSGSNIMSVATEYVHNSTCAVDAWPATLETAGAVPVSAPTSAFDPAAPVADEFGKSGTSLPINCHGCSDNCIGCSTHHSPGTGCMEMHGQTSRASHPVKGGLTSRSTAVNMRNVSFCRPPHKPICMPCVTTTAFLTMGTPSIRIGAADVGLSHNT
mmetsp:Transcript_71636/g.142183  ORF Transcript_71636/g.142183 Transcript_71636/m.142183 type:complete len:210 (+) Transcript_71636:738-1367(+)